MNSFLYILNTNPHAHIHTHTHCIKDTFGASGLIQHMWPLPSDGLWLEFESQPPYFIEINVRSVNSGVSLSEARIDLMGITVHCRSKKQQNRILSVFTWSVILWYLTINAQQSAVPMLALVIKDYCNFGFLWFQSVVMRVCPSSDSTSHQKNNIEQEKRGQSDD